MKTMVKKIVNSINWDIVHVTLMIQYIHQFSFPIFQAIACFKYYILWILNLENLCNASDGYSTWVEAIFEQVR